MFPVLSWRVRPPLQRLARLGRNRNAQLAGQPDLGSSFIHEAFTLLLAIFFININQSFRNL
jgi:hypothetical protein